RCQQGNRFTKVAQGAFFGMISINEDEVEALVPERFRPVQGPATNDGVGFGMGAKGFVVIIVGVVVAGESTTEEAFLAFQATSQERGIECPQNLTRNVENAMTHVRIDCDDGGPPVASHFEQPARGKAKEAANLKDPSRAMALEQLCQKKGINRLNTALVSVNSP